MNEPARMAHSVECWRTGGHRDAVTEQGECEGGLAQRKAVEVLERSWKLKKTELRHTDRKDMISGEKREQLEYASR